MLLAFCPLTLILVVLITRSADSTSGTESWTDCGAAHGQIQMTAFLTRQLHANARQHCQSLHGDLATVYSSLEQQCANAALQKVRKCTCVKKICDCSPRSFSKSSGCGCGAWVGLTGTNISNGQFQTWEWFTTPSSATPGNVTWIPRIHQNASKTNLGAYNPERDGLYYNVKDKMRPYLCQQYFPPAPNKVDVNTTTSTGVNLSVGLHPATYVANISQYCFTLQTLITTAYTEKPNGSEIDVLCGASRSSWLPVTSDTLYNV
eukprot:scpid99503/ scgid26721/ 